MSGTRTAGLARARLHNARWTLAACALALVVVAASPGAGWWLPILAFAGVAAVAAVGQRRPIVTAAAPVEVVKGRADVERLTAIDLAAAVPDALIIFDRAGAVLHANEAAHSAFGELPEGLLLQMRFRVAEMQDLISRVLSGEVVPDAIEFAERIPVERAYRVAAMPIGRGAGVFALVFRDQSEARRIDRMRADFIANASHELRTPLASISGFIETLRGPARNDEKARDNFLQIMQNQTERMARLIDDLLSLSRLEMRTYVRPTTPIDLRAVLQQVTETMGHMARESGVEVKARLGDVPVEVPGNRDELYQVFQNLLENACKYGASGGRVEIDLDDRSTTTDREVNVTIRDYGPGIAEEHIPRITERFYRVDVETSRAQKGTGLGLAIVKHILTRHDARLAIRSKPGEGAAFTVHLHAVTPRPAGAQQ
ncbi:MAG: ATP-binding protein [Mesorhizobium sp.]|nr:ATP-binding protein [Mesorhizobium sp.]